MILNHLTRGHLLVLNADFGRACRRLTTSLTDPEQHHTLPGAIAACNEALAALVINAAAGNPAILQALAAGVPSTRDLSPPRDYADTPIHEARP